MNLKTSILYLAFTATPLAQEIGGEAGAPDQDAKTAPNPDPTSIPDSSTIIQKNTAIPGYAPLSSSSSSWIDPCFTRKWQHEPCFLDPVTKVDPTILEVETQTPGPLPLAPAVATEIPTIEPRAAGTGTGDIQSLDNDDWIPSYDCEGSVMCDTMALKWCDEAVNYHLQRRDDVLYGVSLPKVGACAGWATLGCAVFIQGGDSCNRTGNQIWWDYQDIRKVGHCPKCGTKHWYPGCMTTINYVTWCTSDKVDYR